MKLRSNNATLELTTADVCNVLTEALCDFISPFEGMRVWKITRSGHGKVRLHMELKPGMRPAAKPVSVVDRPKEASRG